MAALGTELSDPKLMGTSEDVESVLPSVRAAIHRTKDREFHGLDLVPGYNYADSPITTHGAGSPGQRLPHRRIAAGDSAYDHVGTGITPIRCDNLTGKHHEGGLIAAAEEFGVPADRAGPGRPGLGGAVRRHAGARPPGPARELVRAASG